MNPKAPVETYRQALFVAFLICFAWVAAVLSILRQPIEQLRIQSEVKAFAGACIPIIATLLVLYPTTLFRNHPGWKRMVLLFVLSSAMLICAVMLVFGAAMIFMFANGAISPD